jgi:hypothetical protein
MDQVGNPANRQHMFRLVCESMLANVIAFEEAGVPLQKLKLSVGRDGGSPGILAAFSVIAPQRHRTVEGSSAAS